MENEPSSGLDRAAVMDCTVRRFTRLDVQLAKQAAEGNPGSLVPNADADRPILVVNAKGDDGALESRIGHSGHREKQLAR